MFQAKSNVEGMSLEKLVLTDYKSFTIQDIHFGFGVAETLDPTPILARKVSFFFPSFINFFLFFSFFLVFATRRILISPQHLTG